MLALPTVLYLQCIFLYINFFPYRRNKEVFIYLPLYSILSRSRFSRAVQRRETWRRPADRRALHKSASVWRAPGGARGAGGEAAATGRGRAAVRCEREGKSAGESPLRGEPPIAAATAAADCPGGGTNGHARVWRDTTATFWPPPETKWLPSLASSPPDGARPIERARSVHSRDFRCNSHCEFVCEKLSKLLT